MPSLAELRQVGWRLALCHACQTCQGSGRVTRSSYGNASLNGGYYGSSSTTDAVCGQCLNGFVFAPLDAADALVIMLEELINHLEDPKNSGLRKRFLDLHITDTELRMTGKAP